MQIEERQKVKKVQLWPTVENRPAFINNDHPKHVPGTKKYVSYWKEEQRRCNEGWWVEESPGVWVYMFPDLYHYINHWEIYHTDEKTGVKTPVKPSLRDVEWVIFSDVFICYGFTGYKDDLETSCNPLLKKKIDAELERLDENGRIIKWTAHDEYKLSLDDYCRKPDGSLKDYMDPLEYVRRKWDKPMGLPSYAAEAQDYKLMTARGTGKDQRWDTVVYKEDGPCQIKDIQVGDRIYDHTGDLVEVIDRADFYNQMQYKVTFGDGRSTYCGGGHLWEVVTSGGNGEWRVMPLKEIRKRYLSKQRINGKRDSKYYVRMTEPVNFPKKDLPIPPYLLGCWLGDGSKHIPSFHSEDKEILDYIEEYANLNNLNVRKEKQPKSPERRHNPNYFTYHLSGEKTGSGLGPNTLLHKLGELNLINNKHIPEIYLRASVSQRMELLQGLMDTDGHCLKKGYVEITQKRVGLSNDICHLLSSLGIKHSRSERTVKYIGKKKLKTPKVYQRIGISTGKPIFKLKRKLERIIKNPKSPFAHSIRKRNPIVSIEPVGVDHSVCLGVASERNLYLCDEYIVTHNSFSWSSIIGKNFKFDGRRENVEKINDQFPISELFVGSPDKSKLEEFIKMIKHGLKSYQGRYKLGKKYKPSPFHRKTKGAWEENSEVKHYKISKNEDGSWDEVEAVSRIAFGIFTLKNPNAAVGKRRQIILTEEFALASNIDKVDSANKNSTEVAGYKSGIRAYIGTSGDQNKVKNAKILFYSTTKSLKIPNYWENPSQMIGRFIPAEYALNWCKDENGNTILDKAHQYYEDLIDDLEASGDLKAVQDRKIYEPRFPKEMFLTVQQDILPSIHAGERLEELLEENYFMNNCEWGDFDYTNSEKTEVRFIKDYNNSLTPIRKYDLSEYSDLRSAFVVIEAPRKDLPGFRKRNSLYKVAYDPVKITQTGTGTSLACIVVWKSVPDDHLDTEIAGGIVGYYIGRREGEDIHKLCHQIMLWYGARCMAEVTAGDFVGYAERNNFYGLLQETPHKSFGNIMAAYRKTTKVGIDLYNDIVKKFGLLMLRKLMMRVIERNEKGVAVRFLTHTLYAEPFLDEVSQFIYSKKLNFDFVSAMILIAIWENQEDDFVPVEDEEEDRNIQKQMNQFQIVQTMSTNKSMNF